MSSVNIGTASTLASGEISEMPPKRREQQWHQSDRDRDLYPREVRHRTCSLQAARGSEQDHGDRTERQPRSGCERRERIDDQHRDQRQAERVARTAIASRTCAP